jgi:hypothetical protein
MDLRIARPQRTLRIARALIQAPEGAPRFGLRPQGPGPAPHSGILFLRPYLTIALAISFLAAVTSAGASAAALNPATIEAWNRYYGWADERVRRDVRDPANFLIQDRLPAAEKKEVQCRLAAGQTYVQRVTGVVPANAAFSVPDGEIHHWWGSILVPGVNLPSLMQFLQDYDHHAGRFSDVAESRLVSRDGNRFVFFFKLSRSKAFVTAFYNSIQEATYYPVDAKHVWSKSMATKIAELDNPGTPQEKERPPGDDRGFLWRLVSWWRFRETDQGVVVEIESASLSRSIPVVAKFIPGLSGYIRSTPRESMESVLLGIQAHFAAPQQIP